MWAQHISAQTKHLKGTALFKHIVQQRVNGVKVKSHEPIMYLDVQHSETQVEKFGPHAKYLRKCRVVSYAYGDGATIKFATQKLGNLGYGKYYGGMQNDPKWIHCLKNRVEFSQSLAAIAVFEHNDTAQAKAALADELQAMTPAARIKLLQKNDVSKLTKKESVSLLLTWFTVKEDAN
jgi:hypothetical protein